MAKIKSVIFQERCVFVSSACVLSGSACLIQGKLPVIKTRDQRVIFGEHMLIQTRRCDLKILLLNISVDICANHTLAFRLTPRSLGGGLQLQTAGCDSQITPLILN